MRKLLQGPCLLLLLTVPLAGQTGEWKTYKNDTGNFTVLFPGEPQDSVNKAEGDVVSHTLMVKSEAGIYTVVYSSMATAQPVDEDTFTAFKKAVFNELPKCDVVDEQSASPAVRNYIGHWYRLSCAIGEVTVKIEGNLYWGKHFAYAVMVMNRANQSTPEGSQRFMDSFAVIDQER